MIFNRPTSYDFKQGFKVVNRQKSYLKFHNMARVQIQNQKLSILYKHELYDPENVMSPISLQPVPRYFETKLEKQCF